MAMCSWCIYYALAATYHILNIDGAIPLLRNQSKMNEYQKTVLERSFAVQFYLNKTSLKELVLKTGLKESQVQHWFENSRREKRLSKCVGKSSLL